MAAKDITKDPCTNDDSDWTTKEGIAKYLKWSIRFLTNQMRERKIPYYRFGRLPRFRISEVEAAFKKAYEVKSIGSF